MIYTSGTTGRPKGVKRAVAPSLGEALARHSKLGRDVGLDGSGPHLITGPMYHAAPLMFAVYDNANGAPISSPPRRRSARWLPDGPGFATLSVVDAAGRSAQTRIYLQ